MYILYKFSYAYIHTYTCRIPILFMASSICISMTALSKGAKWKQMEKSPASAVLHADGYGLSSGATLRVSNSRPKPSFRHPSCARTHSAHIKVQLCRFARRSVLFHTTATSSFMCHVIKLSGDVSQRPGKDMRKKDEEWPPRTGTFCAAWERISVMQWPIFTGHFEALRFCFHFAPLTILSLSDWCMS